MIVEQTKKMYPELPANVRTFALRGSLLLTGWLLVYHLILKPSGIPDTQLSHLVQLCTTEVLSWIYNDVHLIGPSIYSGNEYIITITNPCNGLELHVLYIGFMMCIPTNAKRFWSFAIAGNIIILALNIARCTGLAIMNVHHSYLIDFAHHYAFKLALYAAIFYGWLLYAKKEKVTNE